MEVVPINEETNSLPDAIPLPSPQVNSSGQFFHILSLNSFYFFLTTIMLTNCN